MDEYSSGKFFNRRLTRALNAIKNGIAHALGATKIFTAFAFTLCVFWLGHPCLNGINVHFNWNLR